jgi:hypothetical protein
MAEILLSVRTANGGAARGTVGAQQECISAEDLKMQLGREVR